MENYSYPSYPDSGESSPRAREIDFENPPPWDDQQQNYKAKFMCSYGGKIQPRSHDNQLSYVGGETKILAVDRTTKFPAMLAKLSALCDATPQDNLTFRYQLPGEELDALISVTNEDDLDHMMHEYDRLYRPSARPARMRLFLFLSDTASPAPASAPPDPVKPNNVDFLFGIDKNVAVAAPPSAPVKFHDPVPPPPPPEYQSRLNLNPTDRVAVSDPNAVQRQLQQLQIADSEQGAYRRKSEENYAAGDYYFQKVPEKFPPANFPASSPGYWSEKHVSGGVYPPAVSAASGGGDAPVYMIPAPGTFYHAPVVRPPATQGYYAVQRMASDGYREAPVYGGVPPPKAAVPASLAAAQTVKAPAYTEGFGVVRSGGIPDSTGAPYAQVAYDSASGRQVYYTAPGGVVHAPPYQGVFPSVTADMRPGGVSLGQDVKVISKVTQGSV
ncbi:leucine-rich repeat extensin protein 2 [Spatholobus suberectus]|nr:leucine-rich repeat extensin protein 2 [Spatholobus suberectus]